MSAVNGVLGWIGRAILPAAVTLTLGGVPAPAEETAGCPDTPHRFETFSMAAPALGFVKRILVYLPPGYDCAPDRRYPVFYINDGHDLFDWEPYAESFDPEIAADIAAREAWYGSWHLDGQLDRAMADGLLPAMIVVGIAADDGLRSRDLSPVPWFGSTEARGVDFGRFVAGAVVPAADHRFRTIADRRCRGIGGASLGGISALQIGLAHPDRFGMVLALSPVFRDRALAAYLAALWPLAAPGDPQHVLIDFDDDRPGRADHEWFRSTVAAGSRSQRQVTLTQPPGGRHIIASWADRAVPALERLFGSARSGCPWASGG